MAAGSGLAMLAPEVWLIIAARVVTGVGTGLAFIAAVAWLRGAGALGQGLVGGVALTGAGLAVAVVPHLDGSLGWRAPFLPEIGLAAVAAVLVAAAPGGRGAPVAPRGPLREIARRPVVWRYAAVGAFSFGASFAAGAWIVPLLTQSEHLSARTGGLAGSLILFGGILTRPLGGAVARARPALSRVIMVSSVVVGAAALLLLAVDLGAGPSVVGALLVGLAAGMPYGVAMNGVIQAVPDRPAEAAALVVAAYTYAGVAVVFLLGLAFGADAGRLGFAILAGVMLCAAFLAPGRVSPARRT
jgi:predicted MFS family arabinose efflux permease